MPPISLAPWRELARKAAQALRRQVEQTERGLASFLNPGRKPQAIPVPLPQRRAPRFQGDRRNFSQLCGKSTSGTSVFLKTEFGRSATRPRLTGGTLRSHGYVRSNFSTAQINHAQIVREVTQSISLGFRAGVLNTPFYPPTKGYTTGHVIHGVCGHETFPLRTFLDIPLCPTACFATEGQLTRDVIVQIDEIVCSAPMFLAKLRRDLAKLVRYGNFEYRLVNNETIMRIVFHGRSREEVERFLKDVDIGCGTLTEEHGILHSQRDTVDVNWVELMKPDQKRESTKSLELFVAALEHEQGRQGTTIRARNE